MHTAIAFAAMSLAATLPFASPAPATESIGDSAPVTALADPVPAGSATFGSFETITFGLKECPVDRPYLSNQKFNEGHGYVLYPGIEIRSSKSPSMPARNVTTALTYRASPKGVSPSGVAWVTITNLAGTEFDGNEISVFLHCTRVY